VAKTFSSTKPTKLLDKTNLFGGFERGSYRKGVRTFITVVTKQSWRRLGILPSIKTIRQLIGRQL